MQPQPVRGMNSVLAGLRGNTRRAGKGQGTSPFQPSKLLKKNVLLLLVKAAAVIIVIVVGGVTVVVGIRVIVHHDDSIKA